MHQLLKHLKCIQKIFSILDLSNFNNKSYRSLNVTLCNQDCYMSWRWPVKKCPQSLWGLRPSDVRKVHRKERQEKVQWLRR